MTEDPRATLAELVAQIHGHFRRRLRGLYLFGSLAAGGFYAGRSDLDLIAVLDTDVAKGRDLNSLRRLHESFESAYPAWRDRVEVLYISRGVLATFAAEPTGLVARVSPGEPMHLRALGGEIGWLLDWLGVVSGGETLVGPPPLTLGPPVSDQRFRAAVRSQLRELQRTVRGHDVAFVPVQQGYIAASVARALYSLETGKQTSKENAIAWLVARRPDLADFLWVAYRSYRADTRGPHQRLIDLVDDAADGDGLATGEDSGDADISGSRTP